jgi:hypothetical protein
VCDFFGLQHPHHSADWPSRESSALEPGSAKTNNNGMYIPSIFCNICFIFTTDGSRQTPQPAARSHLPKSNSKQVQTGLIASQFIKPIKDTGVIHAGTSAPPPSRAWNVFSIFILEYMFYLAMLPHVY